MNRDECSRRSLLKRAGRSSALAQAAWLLGSQPNQQAGRKAGWALVGLGRLIQNYVLPAFGECERGKVVALVSGHPDKAARLAAQYGVNSKAIYNYENYESLASNKEVDAVYIALPNSMHAEYAIRGAKAGKHVFCEKPMATTPAQCQAMVDACRKAGRKLMVGYRLRYEPYHETAIRMCRQHELGRLKLILADACINFAADTSEWRFHPQLSGGGVLVDIGVYLVQACRYLTGEEPAEVSAMQFSDPLDPRFREVEDMMLFQFKFPSGVLANCSCSWSLERVDRCRAMGTKGWVEIDPSFTYKGQRLRIHKGDRDQPTEETQPDLKNQFIAEIDHFSDCILSNKDPQTPGDEGLRDVKLMAKIYEAARTRKTVSLQGL